MKKTIKANIILLASIIGIVMLVVFLMFSDRAFAAYREKFAATILVDQDYYCDNAIVRYHNLVEGNVIGDPPYKDFIIPPKKVKVSLYNERKELVKEIDYNNYEQTIDLIVTKPDTTQKYELIVKAYSYWLFSGEVRRADVEIDGTDKCGTYDVDTDDNSFACEQSPDGASVSQEEAVELVRTRPEVQEYISSLSAKGAQGLVEYDHDECNTYSIHVYEIKDDHTATFNWYDVDMYTGEVTTMFDF